jgi:O-acetyl-ADP-ribose deacetylase (regulator of RNase III)
MAKIILESSNILSFRGDSLICFCDSDLTFKKNNPVLQFFSAKTRANSSQKMVLNRSYEQNKEEENLLLKELSAIGFCEIGNAVITKAYGLDVKHFIFVPYIDHNDSDKRMSYVLFHHALRSAFTLANLYGIERLAIPTLRAKVPKKEFMDKIIAGVFETKKQNLLNEKELTDIMIAIVKEFENQSMQEIVIYR